MSDLAFVKFYIQRRFVVNTKIHMEDTLHHLMNNKKLGLRLEMKFYQESNIFYESLNLSQCQYRAEKISELLHCFCG